MGNGKWALMALFAAALQATALAQSSSTGRVLVSTALQSPGAGKIHHVIIIMQENRSFDSYFGTFPGADGIPMKNGEPVVCVPDPARNTCIKPYHDPFDQMAAARTAQTMQPPMWTRARWTDSSRRANRALHVKTL